MTPQVFMNIVLMLPVVLCNEVKVVRQHNPPIASKVIFLERLHPVLSDNFPVDLVAGSALVQTHEARVSHHHVSRLRQAHAPYRQVGGGESFLAETSLHQSEERKAGLRQGVVRLANLRDSQYVGPLRVGSNGDLLNVVFDTGSTNLWFASTLCEDKSCVTRHRYDPKTSTTFQKGAYDLRVTFGTGQLEGTQGIDDVNMGGFTVKQQTFSLIQKEDGSIFDELNFEGILGLAFPHMAANGAVPFFDQVMQQSLLQTNAFSFYFTKLPTDGSAVLFGEPDPRMYHGSLVQVPVVEPHYWMVGLKEFRVGDKVIDGPKKVVFDTGTTYYTVPKMLLGDVLAQMPRTNCEELRSGSHKLPELSFTLEGYGGKDIHLVVPPSDYFVSSGVDGECDPAFMHIEVPSPHGPSYIFGEAFMRTFYTVFHRGDGTSASVQVARQNPDALSLVRQVKRDEAPVAPAGGMALAEVASSSSPKKRPAAFLEADSGNAIP